MRSARPFSVTTVLKLNSLSLFPLTKGLLLPAFGFMTSMSPSLSTRSQSVSCSWFHSELDPLLPSTGWPRSWPTFLIPLLTVNLWDMFIQTRRGRGNWSYLSPLSGRQRGTIPSKNSFSVFFFLIYSFIFQFWPHINGIYIWKYFLFKRVFL